MLKKPDTVTRKYHEEKIREKREEKENLQKINTEMYARLKERAEEVDELQTKCGKLEKRLIRSYEIITGVGSNTSDILNRTASIVRNLTEVQITPEIRKKNYASDGPFPAEPKGRSSDGGR